MTKKFLTAALAAMMLITVPASAKQKSESKERKMAKTEKKMIKRDRQAKCLQLNDSCRADKRCATSACEFEGLNLTEQQQTQLRALKENRRQQMKARKDSAKAEKALSKERMRAERKAMKEKKEAERREYLKEVKKILGNDQYVVFLENQYVQQSGRQPMVKTARTAHKGEKTFGMHSKKSKKTKSRNMKSDK